jgi:hypothetical protein
MLTTQGGERAKRTLRPVTIKQVLDAEQTHPDSPFTIDGIEVNDVSSSSVRQLELTLTPTAGPHCRLREQQQQDGDQRLVRNRRRDRVRGCAAVA